MGFDEIRLEQLSNARQKMGLDRHQTRVDENVFDSSTAACPTEQFFYDVIDIVKWESSFCLGQSGPDFMPNPSFLPYQILYQTPACKCACIVAYLQSNARIYIRKVAIVSENEEVERRRVMFLEAADRLDSNTFYSQDAIRLLLRFLVESSFAMFIVELRTAHARITFIHAIILRARHGSTAIAMRAYPL
uniref:Uncharacterized protein n=1 Tax=Angiostrongylus cantonensis TaxID=6313 RepID=A0A0K0DNV3_ANGCA